MQGMVCAMRTVFDIRLSAFCLCLCLRLDSNPARQEAARRSERTVCRGHRNDPTEYRPAPPLVKAPRISYLGSFQVLLIQVGEKLQKSSTMLARSALSLRISGGISIHFFTLYPTHSKAYQLRSIGNIELFLDMFPVGIDGLDTSAELYSDLATTHTGPEHRQDL